MKKHHYLLIFCAFLTLSVAAQQSSSSPSIAGKWIYEEMYQKETLDAGTLEMMGKIFADLSLELNADQSFKGIMMGTTKDGTWSYDEATHKLTLNSSKGKVEQAEVISLTADRLVLKMEKPVLVLKRA